jgi:hypothetical protein
MKSIALNSAQQHMATIPFYNSLSNTAPGHNLHPLDFFKAEPDHNLFAQTASHELSRLDNMEKTLVEQARIDRMPPEFLAGQLKIVEEARKLLDSIVELYKAAMAQMVRNIG